MAQARSLLEKSERRAGEEATCVKLACAAMRCRFELILYGEDETFLRAVGEDAIEEILALDRQLNFFSARSEIAGINRRASRGPVRVEPRLFELLSLCKELWKRTGGSFDPTIGPLIEAWGFTNQKAKLPTEKEIEEALSRIGPDRIELDRESRTVRFLRDGVSINLGSIGKGYALDRAAEIMREHGVKHALLHGGTSSVCAIGPMPGGGAWPVGLADPADSSTTIATVLLQDGGLGVSGNHLNTRRIGERRFGHVIDPRSGRPVEGRLLSAVVAESCAEADALSTALLCTGLDGASWLNCTRGALICEQQNGEAALRTFRPAGGKESVFRDQKFDHR